MSHCPIQLLLSTLRLGGMPASRAQVMPETHLQREGETHPLGGGGDNKVRNMVSGTRGPGDISPLGQ